MKVCIAGAGAIGGLLGARLAAVGRCELSVLARGATLQALQTHGWRLQQNGQIIQAAAQASDSPAELGTQDLVIVAVKATALEAVAPRIAALLGPGTVVLPAMNGVPWWFAQGVLPGEEASLQSVDPHGIIGRAIDFARVVGCVVHVNASTPEPGFVQHKAGNGLIVGEPDGRLSPRAKAIADLLAGAGFETTLSDDIRHAIWYKLWGNMTINPLSAITGATADRLLDDPLLREFCSSAMREAAAVGARLACPNEQTPEDRHAITRKLGAFKPSMLQDVEAGRPLELDTIVAAVSELGQKTGISTPSIDALLGIARVFARQRGLYPQA
jgi:2-dehydropantoate 2-reductase